jgi:AraC family transcriptional regulator
MSEPFPPEATELIDFSGQTSLTQLLTHRDRLGYDTVTIGRGFLRPSPGAAITSAQLSVVIHDGAAFEMEWRQPGSRHHEHRRIVSGDIHVNPANRPVFKRWQAEPKILFAAFEPAFVERVVSEAFETNNCTLLSRIAIRDPVISGLATAWRQELKEHGASGRLYAESLATALIIHLYHAHAETKTQLRPISGGLGDRRLRLVIEHIEAHYTEDVRLGVLAAVAGLSTHYFSGAFRASTGSPPYRYLIERRLQAAKELLLTTDRSVFDIAFDVGFSSHSHFTFHFRKIVGMTPSQFRQDQQ